MPEKITDQKHGWIAGGENPISPSVAIEKVFGEIMDEGPFDDEEQEDRIDC